MFVHQARKQARAWWTPSPSAIVMLSGKQRHIEKHITKRKPSTTLCFGNEHVGNDHFKSSDFKPIAAELWSKP